MEPNSVLCIRHIKEPDIDAICRISEDLGLSRWSRSDYVDELARDDSLLLIAVLEEVPAGFIVARRVPGTDERTLDAEVYNIGVIRQFQHIGIGSRLIARLLAWAKSQEIVNVWLEVRSSNLSAIGFYRHHGFVEVVTRKGFYNDPPDDAVVMQLVAQPYYKLLNKESLK